MNGGDIKARIPQHAYHGTHNTARRSVPLHVEVELVVDATDRDDDRNGGRQRKSVAASTEETVDVCASRHVRFLAAIVQSLARAGGWEAPLGRKP